MRSNLQEIKRLKYFSVMYANLGLEAFELENWQRALFYLQKALADLNSLLEYFDDADENSINVRLGISDINNKLADVFYQLGEDESRNGNRALAIEYYKNYLEINPQNAIVCNKVGILYKMIDRYKTLDEQIKYFKIARELEPDFKSAIRNLASSYKLKECDNEALECLEKLFELGTIPDDYFVYACLKIKLRDFEAGWKHYESRFKRVLGRTKYPEINKPRWEGQKIVDKTLLVRFEQGYGDSIMFLRYLEQVRPLVKKLIFSVQDSLVDLFQINAIGFEVVGNPEKLSFDCHVPLMSLPYLLGARVGNIPLSKGYIKADALKIKKYKKEYFDNDCFKIGISWNGTRGGNNMRDIPLDVFYPLTMLKNVKIYSFQKDFGSEQLENVPSDIDIVDLGKTFNDFSDTAAAMSNLDLFVTSDNGVFNLAAAMGLKTFLLLNKLAEWRWFSDDETTPWYDSVKIFKKKKEEDSWDLLMQRVIRTIDI